MASGTIIDFEALRSAPGSETPYPHFFSSNMLHDGARAGLAASFPEIPRPGFFPLSEMNVEGAFEQLIDEFTSDEFASIMGQRLGIDLRDKPRLITVRQWSGPKDGRIHNDSKRKIASALIYLNDDWPRSGDGFFRVLRNSESFDDFVCEVPPTTGALIAFRRTENSWHGHLPFVGERRVVQMAYLRSQEDLERKQRRGRMSLFLKNLNPFGRTG